MNELAWHFLAGGPEGPRLRDGRPLEVGRWYEHEGPLALCESGYHASTRALDALKYAPGTWVSLCEIDGAVLRDADKVCARRRCALWAADATATLRLFACSCALDVAHLWAMPSVVRRYLETQDESLRDAARAHAAVLAAGAAAAAARTVVLAAAHAAADSAAWYAATVARFAAWYAATADDSAAPNQHLESLLWSLGQDFTGEPE